MEVLVESIRVSADSTIGYGIGRNRDGQVVIFAGDHRPMRAMGEALETSPGPIVAWVPDDAIIAIIVVPSPFDDRSNGA